MENYQQQRFEFKYLLSERQALAVRDFISGYMRLDTFSAKFPDLSYPVHSLYLDSDQLDLYMHTINGRKNRYKLRIRYYEQHGETPLFFEIKGRQDNVIFKKRSTVKREAFSKLMAGDDPCGDDLVKPSENELVNLRNFCDLRRSLEATPRSQVSYLREAWLPEVDNHLRITFDRDVRTGPDLNAEMSTETKHLDSVFGDQVVLELKFTNRYPNWVRELVRVFNLTQTSAAKYVDGVTVMGEDCLSHELLDQIALHRGCLRRALRRENAQRASMNG